MKHRLSKKLRTNIIRCLMCDDWELGFIAAVHSCTRCQFEGIALEIGKRCPNIAQKGIDLFGMNAYRNLNNCPLLKEETIDDNYGGGLRVIIDTRYHRLTEWMMTKFDLTRENIQHENTNPTSSIT